jgi:hypothetical protein
MTQALYAHVNNKTIKIFLKKSGLQKGNQESSAHAMKAEELHKLLQQKM